MTTTKLYDIFISHSSEDRKLGIALCHFLEERGLRCWIAPRDIQVGKDYGESIVDAIQASSIMIVVFSKSANESMHVRNEVERAFNHQLIIMPFRTQDIIPSRSFEYFLSSTHWLDALEGNAESYFEELYKNCALLTGNKTANVPARDPVPQKLTPPPPAKKPGNKRAFIAIGMVLVIGAIALFLTLSRSEKTLSTPALYDTANAPAKKITEGTTPDTLNITGKKPISEITLPEKNIQPDNSQVKSNSTTTSSTVKTGDKKTQDIAVKVVNAEPLTSNLTEEKKKPEATVTDLPSTSSGPRKLLFADLKSTNRFAFFLTGKGMGNFQGRACGYEIFGKARRVGNTFMIITGNVTGNLNISEDNAGVSGTIFIKSSQLSCPVNLKKR